MHTKQEPVLAMINVAQLKYHWSYIHEERKCEIW